MTGTIGSCILLACTLPLAAGNQKTTVTGRILGEDGKAPRRAAAQLFDSPQGTAIITVETDGQGRFQLQTDRKGLLLLKLSGVGHLPTTALLPLNRPGKISVEARLSRPAFRNVVWKDKPVHVRESKGFKQGKLAPLTDGTYRAEIATDEKEPTVRIATISTESRNFTLDHASEYKLVGKYYYDISVHEAVVRPVDGIVRVVVDPRKLIPSALEPELRVKGLGPEYSRLQEIALQLDRRNYIGEDKMLGEASLAAARASAGKFFGQLENELSWLNLGASLARFSKITADDAWLLLSSIPARSSVWLLMPNLIGFSLDQLPEDPKWEAYVADAAANMPKNVRMQLLGSRFNGLIRRERYEAARAIVAEVEKLKADDGWSRYVTNKVGGSALLTIPGKKLPEFVAHDLTNPQQIYSHGVLAAKARVYLLDFWASW